MMKQKTKMSSLFINVCSLYSLEESSFFFRHELAITAWKGQIGINSNNNHPRPRP